jgi:hypothetical protein
MATQDAAKSFAWFEIPVSVSSEALSARRKLARKRFGRTEELKQTVSKTHHTSLFLNLMKPNEGTKN